MARLEFVEIVEVGRGWNKIRASDGNVYTFKGDYNWRSNNPGNIEYGDFAKSMGAIGSGAVPKGRQRGFAIFPTYEAGHAARVALQFESKGYKDKTILQAIERYAPRFENNTDAYARAVAKAAGVSVHTKMSELTPEQRNLFLAAQERVEGFRPGKIMGETGEPVPASVAQQFSAIPLPAVDIGTSRSVAPHQVPARRPDTVPAFPPLPAPAPLTFGGTVPATASAAAKTPSTIETGVGLGRRADASGSVAFASAPAKSAVPGLGLTVQQVGQQADNARLNGYREIQEMGPSSKGAKPTPQPAAAPKPGAIKTTNGEAQTVAMPRDVRPSSVPPAPETPTIPKYVVTTTRVPIGKPTEKLSPETQTTDRDMRNAISSTQGVKTPLRAPAPLEFKTVSKTVLNPEYVEQQRVLRVQQAQARPVAGATARMGGAIGLNMVRPVQPMIRPAAVGITRAPTMSPAGMAAANPGISHSYSTVAHAGTRTDVHGNDMAFQPRSVQTSDRHNTGY